MKFLIVEDEALYAQQLEMMVDELGYEVAGISESAGPALTKYDKTSPDIALIDIHLEGEMNGLELGKWLNRFDKNIIIIFITSLQDEEYFEQAKEMAAFSFLIKPVKEETLKRTIELAIQHRKKNEGKHKVTANEHLFIKDRSKHIKLYQKDILYVEADDKYCNIVLANNTKHLERTSLTNINKKLDPDLFAQTHRSYIVNLSKVEEIDPSDMTIKIAEQILPLGESFKRYFLKRIGV